MQPSKFPIENVKENHFGGNKKKNSILSENDMQFIRHIAFYCDLSFPILLKRKILNRVKKTKKKELRKKKKGEKRN